MIPGTDLPYSTIAQLARVHHLRRIASLLRDRQMVWQFTQEALYYRRLLK